MILRTVIVDDEPFARKELVHLLASIEDVEVIAQAKNGAECIRTVHAESPDLVLLDVQMPGLDGFETLGLIDPDKMPFVVFVTALDDRALRAFEEGAHDYIVKPVQPQRLAKAIDRVRSLLGQRAEVLASPPPVMRIPCVVRGRTRLVAPEDVLGAYTDVEGVHVITADGTFATDLTLRVLETRIGLFRCHKQHAVRLESIEELARLDGGLGELTLHGGHRAPVGRRHLQELRERLGLIAD